MYICDITLPTKVSTAALSWRRNGALAVTAFYLIDHITEPRFCMEILFSAAVEFWFNKKSSNNARIISLCPIDKILREKVNDEIECVHKIRLFYTNLINLFL